MFMKILKRNQIIISVLALMLMTVGYMNYTSNIKNTVEAGALMDAETMAGIGDAKLVNSNGVTEENAEGTSATDSENKPKSGTDKANTSTSETSSDKNSGSNTNKTNTSSSANNSNSNTEKNNSGTSSNSTDKSSSNTSSNSSDKNSETKNNTKSESTALSSGISTTIPSDADTQDLTTKTTSTSNYEANYFVSSRLERDKMYSQMLETYKKLAESGSISAEQRNISTKEISNINSQKNSIMIAENLIKNLGFEDVVIFVNDKSTSVIVKAEKLQDADVAQIQNIVCREIGVEAEDIHISLK